MTTPRGIAAALAALALVGSAATAHAQLSPGKLSQVHAQLEGSGHCLSCHDPARGVSPPKCLSCHALLEKRIEAGRGLHARPEYASCARCHVEHHGREFQLIFWGKEGRAAFDHQQTGFALQGGHARLSCESCHPAKSQLGAAAAGAGGANPGRTFLGVGTACRNCHADVHMGQFGKTGCDTCHTQEAFKPPTFRHDRTDFPLTGEHAGVRCAQCHKQGQFKGTPDACASCHRDPHEGRMGRACATCHTPEGWARLSLGGFDHGKTKFPLVGRHIRVACPQCHKQGRFKGIPFASCASCHRDPHEGRMGATCSTCHTPEGWTRLRTGGFDHDRTRYPLRGRHERASCDGCHGDGRRRPAFARCTDCHADRHAGQLARRPDGGRCESCHDVNGFLPPRFSAADHTTYPLTGAHLAVPCDACHKLVPVERLRARGLAQGDRPGGHTEQFRFPSTRCQECHSDPHRGQFDRTVREGGCGSCHRTEAWGAVTFDHARTRFPLTGAHLKAACVGCHRRQGQAFDQPPTACASCHQEPHQGQFVRAGTPASCDRCHTDIAWGALRFEHDRDASFRLEGAHRRVPCAGCHKPETRNGVTVTRYRPQATSCRDCHATPSAGRSNEGLGLQLRPRRVLRAHPAAARAGAGHDRQPARGAEDGLRELPHRRRLGAPS